MTEYQIPNGKIAKFMPFLLVTKTSGLTSGQINQIKFEPTNLSAYSTESGRCMGDKGIQTNFDSIIDPKAILMKRLFLVTALIESLTGLLLLISPSWLVLILFRIPIDSSIDLLLGRIAGAGLLSLGIACWLARKDEKSLAANGLAAAMLLYNVIATVLLAYAGFNAHLQLLALWAVVVIHFLMAIWCIKILGEGDWAKKNR